MHPWLKKYIETGSLPTDTEDEKLRKSSLIVMSVPFAFAGTIWGILYFINDLYIPGWIPFSYGILSFLSYIYFHLTKKFRFYQNSQLFLILLLPFLLQLSLGGFVPSSSVIMWALISPVGALVFLKAKQSIGWFVSYLALVIVAYFLNDYVEEFFDWGLSDHFINLVFLLNVIAISSLIYAIQFHFFGNQAKLKEDIEVKNIALFQQSEKLKELDETKSRFFANISHEFRTPLTLILGLVNKQISNSEKSFELQDSNSEKSFKLQDSKTIQRNAKRLLQLINQLLDLSKLESGELKLKVSKGNITQFTKRIASLFESMADSKNIEMTFNNHSINETQADDVIDLHFDNEKLQKVLTNLVSNAVKFTPPNGRVAVNTSILIDEVVIEVSNTGKGIPKEKLPLIFDRFYQVDTASTREYEGTGIGLALVKELVELHHGTVTATSSPDRTIFTVTLPLNISDLSDYEVISNHEDEMIDDELINETVIDSSPSKTYVEAAAYDITDDQLEVLVVEDNPDLRSYIKSILSEKYKVIEAIDGVDGLNKAETTIPDLIVSDVMMPNMDGYELCKQLKTNKKTNHIPVILLTAKALRENKLEGLQYGADDYLIKPFDELELGVRIRNLITIREQLQEKYKNEVWLPNEIKVDSVHHKFLEHAKEAIERNIDNDQFSVDDFGSELAMSRSQLHRKLKALTDQSATTFIRNYRLHRAAELLKQDAGNVTEIAYQVGFNSQTYFSSSFQELFGCSPSAYKEKEA